MPETPQNFEFTSVAINFVYPDNLVSHFTANVIAQFQQDPFLLSFFEISPPPLSGETDEDRLADLKKLDHIEAKCVARIVVTPSRMQDIVNVLSGNLAKYKQVLGDPNTGKDKE
jgi:hypothetical protein